MKKLLIAVCLMFLAAGAGWGSEFKIIAVAGEIVTVDSRVIHFYNFGDQLINLDAGYHPYEMARTGILESLRADNSRLASENVALKEQIEKLSAEIAINDMYAISPSDEAIFRQGYASGCREEARLTSETTALRAENERLRNKYETAHFTPDQLDKMMHPRRLKYLVGKWVYRTQPIYDKYKLCETSFMRHKEYKSYPVKIEKVTDRDFTYSHCRKACGELYFNKDVRYATFPLQPYDDGNWEIVKNPDGEE